MKASTSLFLKTIIITLISFSCFHVSAQNAWSIVGNVADTTDFIGTINSQPLVIKTDSIDRIIIGVNDSIAFKGTAVFDSIKIAEGFIYVDSIRARVLDIGDSNRIVVGDDSIYFKGVAVFDSIKIPNGFIYADSIRARSIHVGDSSLQLGGNPVLPGTDQIQSTNGYVDFYQTGILSTGITTVGPIMPNLTGKLFIWNPISAAFRAGETTGNEWHLSNIGSGSIATGHNTTAFGSSSVAMGSGCDAMGLSSVAMGDLSSAYG